jgi:hypothetical protein
VNAREIVRALNGRWLRGYGVCRCPAHDDRAPSLSVRDGRDGRLLAKCHAGCEFTDVLAAFRGLGLIEGLGSSYRPDPAEAARRRAEEQALLAKPTRQAKAVWAETEPISGTLAEAYLRGRAIVSPLPPTLRFHPSCWHQSAHPFPALVAAVQLGDDIDGIVAVHRTYLAEPDRKAGVEPVKAMLGPVAGGAVRLSAGCGPLVVAEGIETALSLLDGLARLSPRVWAALSAGGISGLVLPKQPGELAIAPDPDPTGMKAAEALTDRARSLGWRVRIMRPPNQGDWNDAAKATGVAA